MRVLKEIIDGYSDTTPAMFVGNGPNLRSGIMPSWKELLVRIGDPPVDFELDGLSNTEVYDLVELASFGRSTTGQIKQKVCDCLALNPAANLAIHRKLMEYALAIRAPVMTTNFDRALEISIGAKRFHFDSRSFTRFYPWKTYYAIEPLRDPLDGFGIWKIHGDVNYRDSIRLGLSDYMGSVERARKLIHSGEDCLVRVKEGQDWRGNRTWMHLWFHKPIIIFGLGCGADEVFIRWLLIERKRFLNLTGAPMNVRFISQGPPAPAVRNLLVPLGVGITEIGDYSELYGD